jgi:hypothetical protein
VREVDELNMTEDAVQHPRRGYGSARVSGGVLGERRCRTGTGSGSRHAGSTCASTSAAGAMRAADPGIRKAG